MKRIINFLLVAVVAFTFSSACDNSSDSSSPEISKNKTRADWVWKIHKSEEDQTQDAWGNWNGIEGGDFYQHFYSFWSNHNGTSDFYMTGYSDRNKMYFSGSWDLGNGGCTVMGQGQGNGSSDSVIDYSCDVSNAGSNYYVSLYGWMDCSDEGHSLVEYYVVENYNGTFNNFVNTISDTTPEFKCRTYIDGSYYSVYRTERVNKPWIYEGTGTFWQYWNIRETKRTSGTIRFLFHWFTWWSVRLTCGSLEGPSHYQIMAIEGNSSKGSIDMTINSWTHGW